MAHSQRPGKINNTLSTDLPLRQHVCRKWFEIIHSEEGPHYCVHLWIQHLTAGALRESIYFEECATLLYAEISHMI